MKPFVKHVKLPHHDTACGQYSLAMATGAEHVTEMYRHFGHMRSASVKEIHEAAQSLGYDFTISKALPLRGQGVIILAEKRNGKQKRGHAVAFCDGKIICPDEGYEYLNFDELLLEYNGWIVDVYTLSAAKTIEWSVG